jgi:hypothetical protein
MESSTVPGITVTDMRRGLSEVRTMLTEQDELRPFNMNEQLCNGMPVWKFVYSVATGLHKKRSKNRRVEKKLSDDQDK